eukprot:6627350-Prymnesium_polylepis.1
MPTRHGLPLPLHSRATPRVTQRTRSAMRDPDHKTYNTHTSADTEGKRTPDRSLSARVPRPARATRIEQKDCVAR